MISVEFSIFSHSVHLTPMSRGFPLKFVMAVMLEKKTRKDAATNRLKTLTIIFIHLDNTFYRQTGGNGTTICAC